MTQDRRSLWLAWGLWHHFWLGLLTAFFGTMATLSTYLDPSGNLSYRTARLWGRFMLRISRTTVQVEGLEHLHPDQTYVFASNHRSNFDIYVLLAILPYRFLWVAKKSLFHVPILGQSLSRMGSIPVDRSNLQEAIRSLEHAVAKVQEGNSMLIFPEGTRGTTRELLPFKKGVFVMALKAGRPVVPVSISGTFAIQPRGSLQVHPGPVKVVISPPIHPRDCRRKEELIARVRQAMAEQYDPDFPYGPGESERLLD